MGTSREDLQLKIRTTLERLPENVCNHCQRTFRNWEIDQSIAPLKISECRGTGDTYALSRLVSPVMCGAFLLIHCLIFQVSAEHQTEKLRKILATSPFTNNHGDTCTYWHNCYQPLMMEFLKLGGITSLWEWVKVWKIADRNLTSCSVCSSSVPQWADGIKALLT